MTPTTWALIATALLTAAPTTPPPPPALTVLVVVDQLAADVFDQKAPKLTGGLGRLWREGVWYRDARYTATPTVTSCGHAALSTGTYGSVHGIGGNTWFDREQGTTVYCAEDAAHHVLGRPQAPHDGTSAKNLLAPTLADSFKAASPKSKVVAIAVKDRSAILLAGHRADAAVWFDRSQGRFSTSDYYGAKVPEWASEENRRLAEYQKSGYAWVRTAASAGIEDDQPFEGTTRGTSRVFPHLVPATQQSGQFSHHFVITPEADRSVLRLAKAAVEAEGLGADEVPDLLLVSLSAHDFVLHSYGPDSAEAAEALDEEDRGLEELLRYLEEKVGRERLVVAVTADHGGDSAPEILQARGQAAGRVSNEGVKKAVEAALAAKFGKKEWLRASTESGLYLLDDGKADFEQVKLEAAKAVAKVPGVAQVLRRGHPEEWLGTAGGRAALKGYHAAEGGDLLVLLRPGWIWEGDVAAHCTAYAYDARVPVVIRAPGVEPRQVARRVDPIDLTSTLAALARVPPPGASEGELLGEVLGERPGAR